jgi:hypothetical protein
LIGCVIFVVIVGTMSHLADKKKAAETLAEANQLWDAGKQQEAVARYRTLVGQLSLLEKHNKRLLFERLIQFDLDHGAKDSARSTLERATKDGVEVVLVSPNGQQLIAELRAAEAAKAAQAGAGTQSSPATKTPGLAGTGSLPFKVEMDSDTASEIELSNFKFANYQLTFDLHWKSPTGRPVDPWHFSAFTATGVKIEGGAVIIPGSMDLGQKVRAHITFSRDNVPDIARVEIHW